ncbi:MAG TPA: DUF4124 domain-containing protein [Steroidobacteraceae bacterium]|nr:DUF4124 domain-containing protein [Steroidobacteraceae bacterium]
MTAILIVASSASAAGINFYRCKDAQGKPHYSSSMPPECQGRDTDVLNERGTVISTIEGEATHAKSLARQEEEDRKLKERNEQAQTDHVLLETYLAVADIERLRDQRLELLEAQLKVAEQHIGTLHDRLEQLKQQAARFKPYNEAPNAPPLPDHIAEALINTIKSVTVDRETIQFKKNEQAELTAKFARDITRFKELKGIK